MPSIDTKTPEPPQLALAADIVMALVFACVGSAILALVFGWFPIDPTRLEAPRWVIASAGGMLIAGGSSLLGLQLWSSSRVEA